MTLAAVGFGVAALIVTGGFVRDLYYKLGEAIIHSQTGHLQVARPALFGRGSRSPEKYLIPGFKAVASKLAHLRHVKEVAGRLSFLGLLSNRHTELPILGEGIEPGKEPELMTALTILEGRSLTAHDRYGVLVGEGLAKKLDLKPGSEVTLLATTVDGAMNSVDVQVAGVFRSFSKDYDARAVKMPLQTAQELLDTSAVNSVVVLLNRTFETDAVLARAAVLMRPLGLVVRSWKQLNGFYTDTVKLFDREFDVLKVIILLMIGLGVSNAVNMAVLERLGEFGTMRALGNRQGHVLRLVMTESVMLGVIGAGAGVLIGILAALLISAVGIPMPPPPGSNIGYTASVQIVPALALQAFLVGLTATTLAGVVPALRVSRVAIVDALRQTV